MTQTANNAEIWRKVDDLSDAWGRLARRRADVWQRVIDLRMTGNERPAERLTVQLHMLDRQGLRLAEAIEGLCTSGAIVGNAFEEVPGF